MEHLEKIKHTLIKQVYEELEHVDIEDIDTCELGKVIDMVKDVGEAMYYYTIVEAMQK